MEKLLAAILQKTRKMFNTCAENMADGIETNNVAQILGNFGVLVLLGLACAGVLVAATYLILRFWWVLIGGLILAGCIREFLLKEKNQPPQPPDIARTEQEEVQRALVIERAAERQDEVRALAFVAIRSAADNTPLVSPRDEFDIQSTRADGNSFYLKDDKVPIFQFEVDLAEEIDVEQEETIRRAIQKYVVKNLPRFPLLHSEEARGWPCVEVLDVKNLGGHVQIDMVLTDSASIPLIEARRRARAEYQMKAQQHRPNPHDPLFR